MTSRFNDYSNNNQSPSARLKLDAMSQWMRDHWMPNHPEHNWVMLSENREALDEQVLAKFTQDIEFDGTQRFIGSHAIDGADLPLIRNYIYRDEVANYAGRVGTFIYRFRNLETAGVTDVVLMAAYYNDMKHIVALSCVPEDFTTSWAAFVKRCAKLARPEEDEVTVIGGNQRAYKPKVEWEDVILPEELKQDIMRDVETFFTRGVEVYRKLELNPFRKILLAGVPGTGKTMLCNALSKWALEQTYTVIYVSSADVGGSHFYKIQQALSIASREQKPALILLEEIDSFLHDKQKALFLNVLDGVESFTNDAGTLLISTTNYPEAIDERVLKRPGRMDRIYIVPPVENELVAERMLRRYLGDLWQDEHTGMVATIVGYPGAFVREMVVYAVTQMIDRQEDVLSLAALKASFEQLQTQIKARDKLVEHNIKNNGKSKIGFGSKR